ncbi:MAG TPA: TetR/AcrR family transcriptional regulator [Microscillaceae bacterium]|nr:TetR/AcrR family transcriptional regulator [Microscillaceae bacterium]
MNKKEQIIDIATKLFSEKGYENTPLSIICEKANVSKGLISHHFKSKDGLLREIFKKSTNVIIKINESKKEDLPVKEQLKDLLNSYFKQLEANKLAFQFDLNVMMQPRTREVLQDLIQERSAMILKYTHKIFDKLDANKSNILSYVFIAELDGIALSFFLGISPEYPLEEIKNHLIEKYLNNK